MRRASLRRAARQAKAVARSRHQAKSPAVVATRPPCPRPAPSAKIRASRSDPQAEDQNRQVAEPRPVAQGAEGVTNVGNGGHECARSNDCATNAVGVRNAHAGALQSTVPGPPAHSAYDASAFERGPAEYRKRGALVGHAVRWVTHAPRPIPLSSAGTPLGHHTEGSMASRGRETGATSVIQYWVSR